MVHITHYVSDTDWLVQWYQINYKLAFEHNILYARNSL